MDAYEKTACTRIKSNSFSFANNERSFDDVGLWIELNVSEGKTAICDGRCPLAYSDQRAVRSSFRPLQLFFCFFFFCFIFCIPLFFCCLLVAPNSLHSSRSHRNVYWLLFTSIYAVNRRRLLHLLISNRMHKTGSHLKCVYGYTAVDWYCFWR